MVDETFISPRLVPRIKVVHNDLGNLLDPVVCLIECWRC